MNATCKGLISAVFVMGLACAGEDADPPAADRVDPRPAREQPHEPSPPEVDPPPPASAGGTAAERIAAVRGRGCPALDGVPPPAMSGPRRVALLVGVGDYQLDSISDLRGPAWDVSRMHALLTDPQRAGFHPDDVCVLLDDGATHARFAAAWQAALVERLSPGDEAVFFFAGHGSQARDWDGDLVDEPDGLDETLMLHDSRVARPDLLDDELNALLAQAHARSGQVTVILDACNSGSATRGVDETVQVRQHVKLDTEAPPGFEAEGRGDYTPADLPGLVALTAALDGTSALEAQGAGLFTTALVGALSEGGDEAPLTYRALGRRLERRVRASRSPQVPTAEGDLDRRVFGVDRVLPPLAWAVRAAEGDALRLSGVPTPGWAEGGLVGFFDGTTSGEQIRAGATPRGTARLETVAGFEATAARASGMAQVGDHAVLLRSGQPPVAVALARQGEGALSADEVSALQAALAAHPQASARLQLGESGALGVRSVGGQLELVGPEGAVRTRATAPAEVVQALWGLARQQALLTLREGGGSLPAGSLSVRVEPLPDQPYCPRTRLLPAPWNQPQPVPLCTRWALRARLSDALPADLRLHLGGVLLSNDGAIAPVPSRPLEPIGPGQVVTLATARSRPPVGAEDGALVFATGAPMDWSRLAGAASRGESASPLQDALMDELAGTRGVGADPAAWTSAFVPIRVVDPSTDWSAAERADPGVCTARKARFGDACPAPEATLGTPEAPAAAAVAQALAAPASSSDQATPAPAAQEPDMSLTAAAFLASINAAQAGAFDLSCVRGCQPGGDETPDLLYRTGSDDPLTLRFVTGAPEGDRDRWRYRLYASNPAHQARLRDRGVLRLQPVGEQAVLAADVSFRADELGTGTFIAAVVKENRKGRKREIVEWRAFRLLTPDGARLQSEAPSPSTKWELDVRPWVLRADVPTGDLPRSLSQATTWWSLAEEESLANLDLDGESSGVPGLGIVLTQPWPAGQGAQVDESSWKDTVSEAISGGVDGHSVRFEGMEWVEKPNRTVDLSSRESESIKVKLAHYYLPITLHTAADALPLQVSSIGRRGTKKTHWVHETSADLKPPNHPRFWSSYSVRDFSADTDLLKLLGKQVKKGGTPPGIRSFSTNDGDGGIPSYEVGFYLQLSPWLPGQEDGVVDAGIVSVDVVAARRGIGAPTTSGSAGRGKAGQVLGDLLGHDGEERSLDLDSPPEGYFIAEGFAKLGTNVGTLRLLEEAPALAQRSVQRLDGAGDAGAAPAVVAFPAPEDIAAALLDGGGQGGEVQARGVDGAGSEAVLLDFPDAVRFVLSAQLRAGALMQEGAVGSRTSVKRMVPVDSYAQYILKVTVAMAEEQALVTNDEALIVTEAQLTAETNIVEKPPGVVDRVTDAVGIPKWLIFLGIAAAVVIALLVMVPGLGPALGNLLKAGSKLGGGGRAAPEPASRREKKPGWVSRLTGSKASSEGPEVQGLGDGDGVIITIKGAVPGRVQADIRMDDSTDP